MCAEDHPACRVLRSFRSGKYLVRSHPFTKHWKRSPLASWSRWQTRGETLLPRQQSRARPPHLRRLDPPGLSLVRTHPFRIRLGWVRTAFPAPSDSSAFSVQQGWNPTVRSLPDWQKYNHVVGVRCGGRTDGGSKGQAVCFASGDSRMESDATRTRGHGRGSWRGRESRRSDDERMRG